MVQLLLVRVVVARRVQGCQLLLRLAGFLALLRRLFGLLYYGRFLLFLLHLFLLFVHLFVFAWEYFFAVLVSWAGLLSALCLGGVSCAPWIIVEGHLALSLESLGAHVAGNCYDDEYHEEDDDKYDGHIVALVVIAFVCTVSWDVAFFAWGAGAGSSVVHIVSSWPTRGIGGLARLSS